MLAIGVEGQNLRLRVSERRGEPGIGVAVTAVLEHVHSDDGLLDEPPELGRDRSGRFGDDAAGP